jgi:hypothetical protein
MESTGEAKVLDTFTYTDFAHKAAFLILLCHYQNQLCITGTPEHSKKDFYNVDPAEWNPQPINVTSLHCRYVSDTMTVFNQLITNADVHFYVERPDYAKMLSTMGMDLKLFNTSSSSAQTMAREVSRNEVLLQNPHPNVAPYHGVFVSPKPVSKTPPWARATTRS